MRNDPQTLDGAFLQIDRLERRLRAALAQIDAQRAEAEALRAALKAAEVRIGAILAGRHAG